MHAIFKDALDVSGVQGVMLYSKEKKLVYSAFNRPVRTEPEKSVEWTLFVSLIGGLNELELLFEKGRLYMRSTVIGPLIVLMEHGPSSLVRLTTELIANNLQDPRVRKALRV
ncbi:MAG: hypothetical protein MUF46_09155 [Desulfobacterales bacterium]|jgi:hypothetical protein|nr:hypothetical protein [Desulfobacterales bacterium]